MALVSQNDIPASAPRWHHEVAQDLRSRLLPPSEFPCTFSQNAWRRGLVWYAFVDALTDTGRAAARADLRAYVADARVWDGQVNTARPLIMAFAPSAARAETIEDYHAIGWRVLQDWLDHDPAPWPQDVARAPGAAYWSMCFDGMQLFVNMSCPAHVERQSRNLGRHFVLVVNPRERFDMVAGDTPEGRRVRTVIRDRCAAYDGMPHAPELGSYQKGEIEWVQYALGDSNDRDPGACPLKMRAAS